MNVEELLDTINDQNLRASLVAQRTDLLSKIDKIDRVLALMGGKEEPERKLDEDAAQERNRGLVQVTEDELVAVQRCFRVGYGYTTRDISKASRLEHMVTYACLCVLRDRGAVRGTGAGRGHRWMLA